MWTNFLLAGVGLALVGLTAVIVIERARVDRTKMQLVDNVLAASSSSPDPIVRLDHLADLPPPVQRYLRYVLRDGQPLVETVRIEQSGTFRTDGTGEWHPFTATQHVTTRPPGFVWDAFIRMLPVIPVRVLDAYHDGHGILEARVGGRADRHGGRTEPRTG